MKSFPPDVRVQAFVEQMLAGSVSTDDVRALDFKVHGDYEIATESETDENGITTVYMTAGVGILGWRAQLAWRLGAEGRVYLHSLAFVRPEGEPIGEDVPGHELAKRLKLGAFARQASQELRRPSLIFWLPTEWGRALLAEVAIPKPGRGREPVFYAKWAAEYERAQEVTPRTPIKTLLEDWPDETEESIRSYLNRARSRGLLTAAEPGRAGGKLTAKAKRILRTYGEEV
jgi:hypothetical protein